MIGYYYIWLLVVYSVLESIVMKMLSCLHFILFSYMDTVCTNGLSIDLNSCRRCVIAREMTKVHEEVNICLLSY